MLALELKEAQVADSINASPTKDFFISMLVRDIFLKEAVIELIDNSIDGAKAICDDNQYEGLNINIKFQQNIFEISDNCGGISLDIAKNYAFRFGRDENNALSNKETTGIFGIGMKRALFKIGSHFVIESKTKNSYFKVNLDIEKWKIEEGWTFQFEEYKDNVSYDISDTGTTITIDSIHDDISLEFTKSDFEQELIEHVERRVGLDLACGLNIDINNFKLHGNNISMIETNEIKPVIMKFSSGNVNVAIQAGIAPALEDAGKKLYDPSEAGWYIYCNRRLVLAADKTSLTTWKDIENKNTGVIFHNNYAGFRGVVFFSSKFPNELPWNTTKTGLDENSNIYVKARANMIEAFYIVKGFIDEMRQSVIVDSDPNEEEASEENSIEQTVASFSDSFVTPESTESREENSQLSLNDVDSVITERKVRISYTKPENEVVMLKEHLRARSNKEVGILTFDYYKDAEC
jgi:hypothetical protein